jgi:uncharacterized protein YjbI with pentapeptide repeats
MVEDFRKSADEAAKNVRSAYLTLLVVWAYLAVTVGATTDEQLLRGTVVALPVIELDLPIVGFYVVAPALFVLLHFNLLIQHQILARKLHDFGKAAKLIDGEDRERQERQKLFPLPFVHLLQGPREERGVMAVMVWTSMIVLPVLLLIGFQVWFLAYQREWVTWYQRLILLADIWLIWWIWPSVISSAGTTRPGRNAGRLWSLLWWSWPNLMAANANGSPNSGDESKFEHRTRKWSVVATLIVFLFSVTLATVRGGYVDRLIPAEELTGKWLPRTLNLRVRTLVLDGKLPDVVKAYATSQRTREVRILPFLFPGLNLRGRNLRGANFYRAKLYNADLHDADLRGANLFRARLQGATMRRAKLQGANLRRARLQGAILSSANLQGADLRRARLQRVNLRRANLEGADLSGAILEGADLSGAKLAGARLISASLRGTILHCLKGTEKKLDCPSLRGTDLRGVRIAGAYFVGSDLRLADLRQINLTRLETSSWHSILNQFESGLDITVERVKALEKMKRTRISNKSLFDHSINGSRTAGAICDGRAKCLDQPDQRSYARKLLEFLVMSACNETIDRYSATGFALRLGRELAVGDEQGAPRRQISSHARDLEAGARAVFAKRLLSCAAARRLHSQMRDKLKKLANSVSKNPAGKK